MSKIRQVYYLQRVRDIHFNLAHKPHTYTTLVILENLNHHWQDEEFIMVNIAHLKRKSFHFNSRQVDHSKGLFHFLVFAKKPPPPRADIDNGIKSVIALLEEEKTFNFIMIGMLIFNCIFCCFLFKFSTMSLFTMSLKQRK